MALTLENLGHGLEDHRVIIHDEDFGALDWNHGNLSSCRGMGR
mgnify:CR=1 FL=1